MKRSDEYIYSGISSFDDFQFERERLLLKKKLIETRIHFSFVSISNVFSTSNFIFTLLRETVLPKISDLFGVKVKKVDSDDIT